MTKRLHKNGQFVFLREKVGPLHQEADVNSVPGGLKALWSALPSAISSYRGLGASRISVVPSYDHCEEEWILTLSNPGQTAAHAIQGWCQDTGLGSVSVLLDSGG
jgi:hypothetical protein